MPKYKITKSGFNYNGVSLPVGIIVEGSNQGRLFLNKEAITINWLDKKIDVPSEHLTPVQDEVELTDQTKIKNYIKNRMIIKTSGRLLGLGAGAFIAYKTNKQAWGYIGFGILGSLVGGLVAGQIANIALADSISKIK